ncbi:hypothetical protein [Streptomyces sp. KL116D]|uniref:hypothetical protein n=1 Tax=Streptomyces sp. KL116D TaxID=3045152 RepID=UPI0035560C2B
MADPLLARRGAAPARRGGVPAATEWESVLLVGDDVTVAAARRWHETIWTIELLVRDGSVDADKWTRAHQLARRGARRLLQERQERPRHRGRPPPSGQWPRPWRAELSG